MRTIKLLLFISSLFIAAPIWSQTTSEDYDYPMTPNAAALTQFGNVPVGLYSGSSQFSVPLYTVQGINLSLPITLNYSSGNGLKVEDLSSWVGAGWTLDAGGLVSRSVKGIPDEMNPDSPPDIDNGCLTVSNCQAIEEGIRDIEYDRFSYNFMGQSGSFIIVGGDVKQLEENGNKINVIGTMFEEFIITDNNGIKYYFGKNHGNGCDPIDLTYKGTGTFNVPTAWYLTKIEHWNKEVIILDYECDNISAPYNINFSQSKTRSVSAGNEQCSMCPLPSPNWSQVSNVSFSTWRTRNVYLKKIYCGNLFDYADFTRSGMKLTKISTATKVIDFIITTPNATTNKFRSYLDKVQFKSKGTPAVNGEKYQFEYYNKNDVQPLSSFKRDMYGYYNGINNSSYLGNRSAYPNEAKTGALSKITYPTGGYSEIYYEGNYQINLGTCNGTTQYPNSDGSFTWSYGVPGGTQLGETTNFIIPGQSILDAVDVTFSIYEGYTQIVPINGQSVGYAYFTIASEDGFAYNFPQPTDAVEYSVPREITVSLPPGNYTIGVSVRGAFYKAAYRFGLCDQFPQPTKTQFGGIRVSAIKNFAFNGNVATSKTYTYCEPDRAIPKPYILTYNTPQDCLIGLGGSEGYCMQQVQSNSTPFSRTGLTDFFYPYVIENIIDQNIVKSLIGHQFSTPRYSAILSPLLGCDVPEDFGREYFGSPFKTKTKYYMTSGNKTLLIKEERNEYPENMEILETFKSYSRNFKNLSGPLVYSATLPPGQTCVDFSGLAPKLQLGLYKYARTWFPMKAKVIHERVYDDSGQLKGKIITTTNYFYDNPIHRQMTRQEDFTSEFFTSVPLTGEVMKKITTKYTYPDDITNASTIYGNPLDGDAFTAVNDAMKSDHLHITGTPIQIEKIDNDGNHLETTRSNFKIIMSTTTPPRPLPLLVSTQKLKGNYSIFNPFINNKTFSHYNLYNLKPQQIEDSETSKVTSILYGYNHRYPVLIAKNYPYNTYLNNFYINSSGLHDYGDQIETIAFSTNTTNSMSEGFMYKKLVGVSKKFGSDYMSTYYVYDELNRLIQIKDHDGNILSQYEYHYGN